MRRSVGVVLKQRVALAVIVALAFNPSVTMAAGGPPEAASLASAASVGLLAVESAPAGADVYLDGHLTGQTPLHVGGLASGDHRVRVVKSGYLENARVVSVGTSPNTVRVQLTRDVGSRPELAAQLGGGGGGGGGGGSKLPLILALAGGGAVAAVVLAKKSGDSSSSTPATPPPTVTSISAAPTTGIVATVTTFAAVGASDSAGRVLTFAWDFGDGGTGTGASPTHTYAAACTCTVKVTVTAGADSASTTTSFPVKTIAFSTWAVTFANFSGSTMVSNVTQAGTSLGGTYQYSFNGSVTQTGTISGSINATTRVVTIAYTATALSNIGAVFTFTNGVANTTVTTLAGTTVDTNGLTAFGGTPTTMTRP